MLSDERLAEIAAADRAATPGPWHFIPVRMDADRRDQVQPAMLYSADDSLEIVTTSLFDADGAFIACARQAVPDLLAEVQRLRQLLTETTEALESSIRQVERLLAP